MSTVQDGVLKEFPALVNTCEYMNINIFIEYIRNDTNFGQITGIQEKLDTTCK
jgi:hypothetical protein